MKFSVKKIIFSIISIIALIFIDQFTKYLAVINLKGSSPFVIIKDVFELHYLENTGAAFGILSGQKIILVIVTAIIIILLALLYFKLPTDKRYTPLRIIEIFLFAGAIGNMIDRVLYNYVIDFFYFKLINFPIFNVADCYVTVAVFVLFILVMFYYKDKDFDLIFPSKKKEAGQ